MELKAFNLNVVHTDDMHDVKITWYGLVLIETQKPKKETITKKLTNKIKQLCKK